MVVRNAKTSIDRWSIVSRPTEKGAPMPPLSLRALRAERGLTLEALAILSDVDVATISRIERHLVEARPATVVKLARGLGIAAKRMKQIVAVDDSLLAS